MQTIGFTEDEVRHLRALDRHRPAPMQLLHERSRRGHFEQAGANQVEWSRLEPLVDEADTTKVKAIRILSGPDGVNDGAVRDFRRFQKEMGALGIAAEWCVVPNQDRDWHDRVIVTEGRAWNVPPINTVYQGRYSEIGKATIPPFDRWWAKAAPIS